MATKDTTRRTEWRRLAKAGTLRPYDWPSPAPPAARPPTGRRYYLPEGSYYLDVHGRLNSSFDLTAAEAVTLETVCEWADSYYAVPLTQAPAIGRGGRFSDTLDRKRLILETLGWLKSFNVDLTLCRFDLLSKTMKLLDQVDGMPGALCLTPQQWNILQDRWSREGVPVDFYFRADAQREVIEPIYGFGGIFLGRQLYSPRQWERRDHDTIARLEVPTTEDSRLRFLRNASRFAREIMLRRLEMQQPGREPGKDELADLSALFGGVTALLRTRGSKQP